MLTKTQIYGLTDLLYPAFFAKEPALGYTQKQIGLWFDKASREDLEESCTLLQTALALEDWDMRAALPGTPRTSEELRIFSRCALQQLRSLLEQRDQESNR